MYDLVVGQVIHLVSLEGCYDFISSFCSVIVFMMQTMFSRTELNTKIVGNFHAFLVLKFHDFSPVGLRVIGFTSSLSSFCLLSV
jgi:hypothetical protein